MKIGIIGTGRIAKRFIPEALSTGKAEVTAIYNPKKDSADRFVKENCVDLPTIAAGGVEEFMSLCEAVYIASPHETHYEYIKSGLLNGKHVLCEKPMVLERSQAEECFRIAAEKKSVLIEGIKTAYCPGYKKLISLAENGMIGEIRYISSCFTKLEDKNKRELTDTKYGGSFTELGSYVMLPLFDVFGGDQESLRFTSIYNDETDKSDRCIDLLTKTDVTWKNGFATAICGLGAKSEGSLIISGTKGYIKAEAPWWKTGHIEVHFENEAETVIYDELFEKDGLRYEIEEFIGMAETGGCKADIRSQKRSVWLAEMMESFLDERNNMKNLEGVTK